MAGRAAQDFAAAVNIFRLTAAAVISYLLTLVVTSGAIDLTGPLTALLVMQASAYSTLKMGAVRVGAVLAGVLVATFLSVWIGLTWWSLGLAIAASLLLARIFRLGEQALEAPISAMLILGVTSPNVAAEIRILNTLIGAGVGIAFNLIYPPALPTRRAGRAVIDVAEATAAPLDVASQALAEGPIRREQVQDWLNLVRASARRLTSASETVSSLKDSRRFNPRALAPPTSSRCWRAVSIRWKVACSRSAHSSWCCLQRCRPKTDLTTRTVRNCVPHLLLCCMMPQIASGHLAASCLPKWRNAKRRRSGHSMRAWRSSEKQRRS